MTRVTFLEQRILSEMFFFNQATKKKSFAARVKTKIYIGRDADEHYPAPNKPRFASLSGGVFNNNLKDKDSKNTNKDDCMAV
jgi:hypothetical protein